MSINFDRLVRFLPHDDCSSSRKQRNQVWEKWDTNLNGFLNISDIETEFVIMFEIKSHKNIQEIIKKSVQSTKQKLGSDGKLGENYLQKRQFKLFLQNLHKHVRILLIFQSFDLNHDKIIEESELIDAYKLIFNHNMSDGQLRDAKQISNDLKMSYSKFSQWFNQLQVYNDKVIVLQ